MYHLEHTHISKDILRGYIQCVHTIIMHMSLPITRHMPASSSLTSLYHKSLIEASPNEMYGADPVDVSI